MTAMLPPLDKNPILDPSQDFYLLRRQGIGFVQNAGSDQWTDYNVHDPGITILEALCYAITDLGFRLGWKITDILAPATKPADPTQPYPNQTFFTAHNILTINPTTSDDFRRALIDLASVRDAWLICKSCACDVSYWAYCDLSGQLVLQYGEPQNPPNPAKEVWAIGLYDVLLELESDSELGDLNDRMIVYNTVYHDAAGAHPVIMELRFPDIALLERDPWQHFLSDDTDLTVELVRLGATKTDPGPTGTYNVYDLLPAKQVAYIQKFWNGVFYLGLKITMISSGQVLDVENASVRIFADNAVRNTVDPAAWRALFEDASPSGFAQRYRKKARAT